MRGERTIYLKLNILVLIISIIILAAGCIYVTPDAQRVGDSKEYNSATEIQKPVEHQSAGLQNFNWKKSFPTAYLIKSIDNVYDDCDGCLDYVSAATTSMAKYDSELNFATVVSISGAVRLNDRETSSDEFFGERLQNYGFTPYFGLGEKRTRGMLAFTNRYKIYKTNMTSIPYLKSLVFSEIIPIVAIDKYYIFSEQAPRYNRPNFQFEQAHEQIFMNVVGYEQKIKVHDHGIQGLNGAYLDVENDDFMSAWNSENLHYGSQFAVFLVKTSSLIDSDSMTSIIRKDLNISHRNLKTLNLDTMPYGELQLLIKQGYSTRKSLAEYFKDNQELSHKFWQSSIAFKELINEKNLNKLRKSISEIIEMEKWD